MLLFDSLRVFVRLVCMGSKNRTPRNEFYKQGAPSAVKTIDIETVMVRLQAARGWSIAWLRTLSRPRLIMLYGKHCR